MVVAAVPFFPVIFLFHVFFLLGVFLSNNVLPFKHFLMGHLLVFTQFFCGFLGVVCGGFLVCSSFLDVVSFLLDVFRKVLGCG